MVRARPTELFARLGLVLAAAETFIAKGYHRTQMQDVAELLGVTKGTQCGYVESKAGLLAAALRYADGVEPPPGLGNYQCPPPPPVSWRRSSPSGLAPRWPNCG